MSGDDLRGAVRALRDEAQGSSDTASATRMRILGTVRAKRRRNVTLVRATAVLLAAALGGVAWASTTGRLPSLSVLLSSASETEGIQEASTPRGGGAPGVGTAAPGRGRDRAGSEPVARGDTAPSRDTASSAEPPATTDLASPPVSAALPDVPNANGAPEAKSDTREPGRRSTSPVLAGSSTATSAVSAPAGSSVASAPAATSAVSAPAGSAAASAPAASSAPSTSGASAPEAPGPDASADALYQRAHDLHFQAGNWASARAAWDAYLAAAPGGRFATFAHYNRALCLLRLGRTGEARRVLALFASGAFGGYRRAEAQSLLDALDAARSDKGAGQ